MMDDSKRYQRLRELQKEMQRWQIIREATIMAVRVVLVFVSSIVIYGLFVANPQVTCGLLLVSTTIVVASYAFSH